MRNVKRFVAAAGVAVLLAGAVPAFAVPVSAAAAARPGRPAKHKKPAPRRGGKKSGRRKPARPKQRAS